MKRALSISAQPPPARSHTSILPPRGVPARLALGDVGAATTRAPVISVGGLPEGQTDTFLRTNYAQLSPEARRFVTDEGSPCNVAAK